MQYVGTCMQVPIACRVEWERTVLGAKPESAPGGRTGTDGLLVAIQG